MMKYGLKWLPQVLKNDLGPILSIYHTSGPFLEKSIFCHFWTLKKKTFFNFVDANFEDSAEFRPKIIKNVFLMIKTLTYQKMPSITQWNFDFPGIFVKKSFLTQKHPKTLWLKIGFFDHPIEKKFLFSKTSWFFLQLHNLSFFHISYRKKVIRTFVKI